MNKLKILSFFLLYSLFLSQLFSTNPFISEIAFIDEEFIEIISTNSINFSNSTIYDSKPKNSNNTLTQIKYQNNSNISLIIGSNFKDNYNLENLNCSIYLTSGTQVSKGGLLSSGENITIYKNESFNISFTKTTDLNFKENQTLNFEKNHSIFVSTRTPCLQANQVYSNTNITNQSTKINISQTNLTKICGSYFKIEPLNTTFFDTIKFKFKTNLTNYSIEYWVENFKKETTKQKVTTTNTNTKQYTPKQWDLYTIHANLRADNNCSYKNISQVLFYKKEETIQTSSKLTSSTSKSSSKSDTTTKLVENLNTKIEIKNIQDIINKNTNQLKLEITRGKISKRVVHVYLNKEKIFSIEPNQNTKNKITIPLSAKHLKKSNLLEIEGLDLYEKLEFNSSIKNKDEEETKEINKNQTKEKIELKKISSSSNDELLTYQDEKNLELYSTINPSNLDELKNIEEIKPLKTTQILQKENSYFGPFTIIVALLGTILFIW